MLKNIFKIYLSSLLPLLNVYKSSTIKTEMESDVENKLMVTRGESSGRGEAWRER